MHKLIVPLSHTGEKLMPDGHCQEGCLVRAGGSQRVFVGGRGRRKSRRSLDQEATTSGGGHSLPVDR
jgi:hypothetical protein